MESYCVATHRLQRQMALGEALQPQRRIELGPFRAQAGDGIALLADFRMQPQHPLGARRWIPS